MTNAAKSRRRTATTRAARSPKSEAGRVIRHAGPLVSAQQAREQLTRKGITLRQFADDNGLNYATVRKVLDGRNSGRYGEAHKAAVALKMKHGTAVL